MSGGLSRKAAAAVMIALIVLALPLGAASSGRRLYNKVEAAFSANAASDLAARIGAAENMTVVAGRYLAPDDQALTAVSDAAAELGRAKTLRQKYDADAALAGAVLTLSLKLTDSSLSDKDEQYRSGLYADFVSAGQKLSHDAYNDAARAYNEKLKAFPGRLFFALFGYKEAPIWQGQ